MPNSRPPITVPTPKTADFTKQYATKQEVEQEVSRLKEWVAQSQQVNAPKESTNPLVDISHFGLKTPLQLAIFLRSPAGEDLVKELVEHELAIVAERENTALAEREHQLHRRYTAFLLLGLLYKHNAHAHELVDRSLQEFSKVLHGDTTHHGSEVTPVELDFSSYTSAEEQVQAMLHRTLQESGRLEQQLAAGERQHQEIKEKYDKYHAHLDAADQEFLQLEPGTATEKTEQLVGKLTQQISDNAASVAKALEDGRDEEARTLMHEGNALNLRVAALREMQSVAAGNSDMYDLNYKVTKSPSDAMYILPAGSKLVEDNGKQFLLRPGQDLKDMSVEQKAKAQQAFNKLNQADVLSTRQLVLRNHELEVKSAPDLAPLLAKSEQAQRDILHLASRLSAMQETSNRETKTELSLKPTPTNAPALKMTPLPSAPSPQPRPSNALGDSYRQMLLLMQHRPTRESLQWLKDASVRAKAAPELIATIQNLKVNAPIPETTMRSLLSMNPQGRAWANPAVEEHDTITKQAPSPFKMTPR